MSAEPTVGFLGPAGTFSEVAASRLAGPWAGDLLPVESIINLIQGRERRRLGR